MKRTAFILLLIMVCYQTPANQLLRLPILVEHFLSHKSAKGTSLLDFLKEHYATNHQDADQSEDEQLPFKSAGPLEISFAIIPVPITITRQYNSEPLKKSLVPSHLITRQEQRGWPSN